MSQKLKSITIDGQKFEIDAGGTPTPKILTLTITPTNYVEDIDLYGYVFNLTEEQISTYDVINIVSGGTGYEADSIYYVKHPLFTKSITINFGLRSDSNVVIGMYGDKETNIGVALYQSTGFDFNGYTFLNQEAFYNVAGLPLSNGSLRMVYDGFVSIFATVQYNGEI